MRGLRTRGVRLAALAAVALVLPGCGYSLSGKGNTLDKSIRVIGVPVFVNSSTVPDVEVVLTDAVRTEFQSHSHYKTVPDAEGADAVFTATIRSVSLTPIVTNTSTRQVTRYRATVTVEVLFKDKDGKTLYQNRAAQYFEEYDVTTSTTANDPSAFFGQDRAALQRLAKTFAQSVVTSILEAF